MPLVKAKLRMETLADGDELVVLATDPEAAIDLAAWAADEGHELQERAGDGWTEFVLRKGGAVAQATATTTPPRRASPPPES
jgi:tRNA 2-thiouridine synthesizing protein A